MNLGVIDTIQIFVIRLMITLAAMTVASSEMAFAEEEAPDYFATHSQLNDQNVRNLLSQERCYANEQAFLGCILAVNTLLNNADVPMIFTNYRTQKLPEIGEVVKAVENIQLQKINTLFKPDSNKTPVQLAKENDLATKQSHQAWRALFAETQNDPVSFAALLNEALAQKISKYRGQVLAMAINSYLNSAVDPHTNLWSIKETEEMMNTKEETFTGIGSQLSFNRELKIELYPMEESPSLAAGVRKKDILTHINGRAVQPKDREEFNNIIDLLLGEENTSVSITVLRAGKRIELTITRRPISIKILDGKIITNSRTKQKIGHIRLHSFMQKDLCKDFVTLAKDLHSQGAESLILDVRGNAGGDLREVLCMVSSFVEVNQNLLLFQDPQTNLLINSVKNNSMAIATRQMLYAPQAEELYNLFNKKPLVVLQDARSGSASELLPGALQSYGRVVTVGVRSYGKGTMQQGPTDPRTVGLDEIEGTQLLSTAARFHFADGSTNQITGILPDFEVYANPNPTEEDLYARREADLYTNAVHAGIKKPKGISTETKARITNCMNINTNIAGEYTKDEQSALGADYQLLTAKAVASCL
ncbi:MAG: S41 family peptidase [Bdellovibrionota bacterium]